MPLKATELHRWRAEDALLRLLLPRLRILAGVHLAMYDTTNFSHSDT